MNLTKRQRTVDLHGHKQGITLTESEWAALELVATAKGLKWHDYVRVLCADQPEAAKQNMTGLIRVAVTNALLIQQTLDHRAEAFSQPQSPLMQLSGVMSDADLDKDLKAAKNYGGADMGGYTLLSGLDQFGRSCIWVVNNLKGGSHVAIPMVPEIVESDYLVV